MYSHAQAVAAARRASLRSATEVRVEMRHGLNSLAAIAATAPWVGLTGTIRGVYDSFPACRADRATCMALIFDHLGSALVPAAVGLFVALMAGCCHRYLNYAVRTLDLEMEDAAEDLARRLRLLRPGS